jgi:hypothetical protein
VKIDFNLISFIVSIASLIVSGFAIWLAVVFKKEADRVNQKTVEILVDIRTDAKAISAYAIPELTRYGETSRQAMLGVMMSSTHANITMTDTVPDNVSEANVENEERTDAVDR